MMMINNIKTDKIIYFNEHVLMTTEIVLAGFALLIPIILYIRNSIRISALEKKSETTAEIIEKSAKSLDVDIEIAEIKKYIKKEVSSLESKIVESSQLNGAHFDRLAKLIENKLDDHRLDEEASWSIIDRIKRENKEVAVSVGEMKVEVKNLKETIASVKGSEVIPLLKDFIGIIRDSNGKQGQV